MCAVCRRVTLKANAARAQDTGGAVAAGRVATGLDFPDDSADDSDGDEADGDDRIPIPVGGMTVTSCAPESYERKSVCFQVNQMDTWCKQHTVDAWLGKRDGTHAPYGAQSPAEHAALGHRPIVLGAAEPPTC